MALECAKRFFWNPLPPRILAMKWSSLQVPSGGVGWRSKLVIILYFQKWTISYSAHFYQGMEVTPPHGQEATPWCLYTFPPSANRWIRSMATSHHRCQWGREPEVAKHFCNGVGDLVLQMLAGVAVVSTSRPRRYYTLASARRAAILSLGNNIFHG